MYQHRISDNTSNAGIVIERDLFSVTNKIICKDFYPLMFFLFFMIYFPTSNKFIVPKFASV